MKQAMRELFDDIPDDLVGAILAAAAEERKND